MKPLLPLTLLLCCLPAYATVPSDSASTAGPYACDGEDTTFTFSFGIDDDDDIQVIKILVSTGTETVLTKTTDYTITSANANDPLDLTSGGTVTTTSAYSSLYTVFLRRNTVKTQTTNIDDEDVETGLDKLTRIVQDLSESIGRCLKNQPSDTGDTTQFISPDTSGAGYAYRSARGNWSIASNISIGSVLDANFWDVAIPHYGAADGGDPNTIYWYGNDLYAMGPDSNYHNLTGILNEDDFATAVADGANADLLPPTQDSVYNYILTGTVTMTNKTLTSPTITTGTLTSPVLNTGLSGTAFLDEDTMSSDSATKAASQQSIKAYVDTQVATKGITASGSTVFNSTLTAAGTFQDLDLSSVVGATTAMVFLEVTSNGVGHYCVKPKGYGSAYANHTNNSADLADNGAGACAAAFEASGEYRYVTCVTSSAGVVQHAYSDNSDTVVIKLVAYIK